MTTAQRARERVRRGGGGARCRGRGRSRPGTLASSSARRRHEQRVEVRRGRERGDRLVVHVPALRRERDDAARAQPLAVHRVRRDQVALRVGVPRHEPRDAPPEERCHRGRAGRQRGSRARPARGSCRRRARGRRAGARGRSGARSSSSAAHWSEWASRPTCSSSACSSPPREQLEERVRVASAVIPAAGGSALSRPRRPPPAAPRWSPSRSGRRRAARRASRDGASDRRSRRRASRTRSAASPARRA